jgi:hypothetical protein
MAKRKRSAVAGIATGVPQDWQAESDLRTLIDACEIRKDKKRYAAAQALAKDKLTEMAKVAGGEAGEY